MVQPSRRVFGVGALLCASLLATGAAYGGQAESSNPIPLCTRPSQIPSGFTQRMLPTPSGVRIHAVIGGRGPTVVLLHGYPETFVTWEPVLAPLARRYRVIALDLTGLGDSTVPQDADLSGQRVASDLHAALGELGVHDMMLVGHDWGGEIATSYALRYRSSLRKLIVMEAPPATEFERLEAEQPGAFWFNWLQLQRGFAEELVAGRERLYITRLLTLFAAHPDRFTRSQVTEYVCSYSRPGSLRAAFDYYRDLHETAIQQDAQVAHDGPFAMPVLVVGGAASLGAQMPALYHRFAPHADAAVMPDASHFVLSDNPGFTLATLTRFLAMPGRGD